MPTQGLTRAGKRSTTNVPVVEMKCPLNGASLVIARNMCPSLASTTFACAQCVALHDSHVKGGELIVVMPYFRLHCMMKLC